MHNEYSSDFPYGYTAGNNIDIRVYKHTNWENEAEKLLELADMYTNHERELAFNKSTTFSYEQLNLETKTQSSYLRELNKLENV